MSAFLCAALGIDPVRVARHFNSHRLLPPRPAGLDLLTDMLPASDDDGGGDSDDA